jgi:hypothetical protein
MTDNENDTSLLEVNEMIANDYSILMDQEIELDFNVERSHKYFFDRIVNDLELELIGEFYTAECVTYLECKDALFRLYLRRLDTLMDSDEPEQNIITFAKIIKGKYHDYLSLYYLLLSKLPKCDLESLRDRGVISAELFERYY